MAAPAVVPQLPGAGTNVGGAQNSLINSITAPNYNQLLQGLGGQSPAVKGFANLMTQANTANAARGQDILKLLQTQGGAAKANNQEGYNNELGSIQNDMVSKGLAGTSIGDSLNLGASKNLAQENAGVDETTSLNMANVANSFSQQAPSLGLLAQLMSAGGGSKVQAPTAAPSIINPGAAMGTAGGQSQVPYNPPAPKAQFIGGGGNTNYGGSPLDTAGDFLGI